MLRMKLAVRTGAALLMVVAMLAVIKHVHADAAAGGRTVSSFLSLRGLVEAAAEFWDIVGPGGKLHPAYFLEHKGHLVVEGLLAIIIGYLLLQHSFKPHPKSEASLTDKEIDSLCDEWQPEPLVPAVDPDTCLPEPLMVTKTEGKHIVVNGKKALNLATHSYLGFMGDKDMNEVARKTIEKYGVGSCGPRNFYGTIDVHLALEEQLAAFMGTGGCIIYSYEMATVASIIPAFASRKDVVVVDEMCHFAIQQGVSLSRANVYTFKHNDMADLERVLKGIDAKEKAQKRPLSRRLIVVEGVYMNSGDVAPLDELYRIKEQYKYRLLVEESHSFGVLGATGRGACEHFGLKPDQIDIICASMGNALGSVGGFCVGAHEIVDHQRLGGSGYVFSASLPPYLATAASHVLEVLKEQGPAKLLPAARSAAERLRAQLGERVKGLTVVGAPTGPSPVIHLQLSQSGASKQAEAKVLQQVADHALQEGGVLVVPARYSVLDRVAACARPSLRLTASAALTPEDIEKAVEALAAACKAAGL